MTPSKKQSKRKVKRTKAVKWIARYGCGCTADGERKADILEYCAVHGHDRKEIYKLPPRERGKR